MVLFLSLSLSSLCWLLSLKWLSTFEHLAQYLSKICFFGVLESTLNHTTLKHLNVQLKHKCPIKTCNRIRHIIFVDNGVKITSLATQHSIWINGIFFRVSGSLCSLVHFLHFPTFIFSHVLSTFHPLLMLGSGVEIS